MSDVPEELRPHYAAVHTWLNQGNDAALVLVRALPDGMQVIPASLRRARKEWPTKYPAFASLLDEALKKSMGLGCPVCIVIPYEEAGRQWFLIERGRARR